MRSWYPGSVCIYMNWNYQSKGFCSWQTILPDRLSQQPSFVLFCCWLQLSWAANMTCSDLAIASKDRLNTWWRYARVSLQSPVAAPSQQCKELLSFLFKVRWTLKNHTESRWPVYTKCINIDHFTCSNCTTFTNARPWAPSDITCQVWSWFDERFSR